MDKQTFDHEFKTWLEILKRTGQPEPAAKQRATMYATIIASRGGKPSTDRRGVRG